VFVALLWGGCFPAFAVLLRGQKHAADWAGIVLALQASWCGWHLPLGRCPRLVYFCTVGACIRFAYDANNNLTSLTDGRVQTHRWSYDARFRGRAWKREFFVV